MKIREHKIHYAIDRKEAIGSRYNK